MQRDTADVVSRLVSLPRVMLKLRNAAVFLMGVAAASIAVLAQRVKFAGVMGLIGAALGLVYPPPVLHKTQSVAPFPTAVTAR